MTDKLIIFDTTLRDGEQSPGASMTRERQPAFSRVVQRVMDVQGGELSSGELLALYEREYGLPGRAANDPAQAQCGPDAA